jgi:hypothetical protein
MPHKMTSKRSFYYSYSFPFHKIFYSVLLDKMIGRENAYLTDLIPWMPIL